ncbi:hypothetical protein M121_4664, partial [Bacteroides fragilis str. 3783N2-1]
MGPVIRSTECTDLYKSMPIGVGKLAQSINLN